MARDRCYKYPNGPRQEKGSPSPPLWCVTWRCSCFACSPNCLSSADSRCTVLRKQDSGDLPVSHWLTLNVVFWFVFARGTGRPRPVSLRPRWHSGAQSGGLPVTRTLSLGGWSHSAPRNRSKSANAEATVDGRLQVSQLISVSLRHREAVLEYSPA